MNCFGKSCWANAIISPFFLKEDNTIHINGNNLFANCSKLETVSLANVISIPDSMFTTCSNLVYIDIPETVTNIGSFAFNNCSKLASITIPSEVKSIGQSCFMGCTNLGDINSLPSTAPSLGIEVFGNSSSNYTGNKASVKGLHVPRTATGYESNDWQTVLQDIVGFTLYKDL